MLALVIVFVLDAILYLLLKTVVDLNILNIISLLVFSVLVFRMYKKNTESKHLIVLLVVAYILKMGYMFFDIYANGTYLLINNTIDAAGFHRVALNILNGTESLISAEKGFYSVFVAGFYKIFGINRLMVQQFGLMLYSVTQILFLRIGKMLGVSEKKLFFPLLIICFLPASFLFAPALMRETFIILLITLSMFFFIRWFKGGTLIDAILSIIFPLLDSILHMGCTVLIPIFIFVIIFYNREKKHIVFNTKAVMVIVIVVVSLAVFLFSFSTLFLEKLEKMNMDGIESLYEYLESTYGESAYLTEIDYNNPWDIIKYSIPRVFYYLASPVPWEWRGLKDAGTFFADALVYIVFVGMLIPMYIKTKKENRGLLLIFILQYLLFIFVFAHGTYTSGAAVRHRFKGILIMSVIYMMSAEGDIFGFGSRIANLFKMPGKKE